MKFTNGYWLIREGIDAHFASCVYEAEQQDDELVVYAPERRINHRGDTLGGVLLTVRYSSPMKNIIKVRISHHEGGLDKGPHFQLDRSLSKAEMSAAEMSEAETSEPPFQPDRSLSVAEMSASETSKPPFQPDRSLSVAEMSASETSEPPLQLDRSLSASETSAVETSAPPFQPDRSLSVAEMSASEMNASEMSASETSEPHLQLDRSLSVAEMSGESFKPTVRITKENAVLESGELSVTIERGQGWNNCFSAGGKVLTKNLFKSTGYMTERGNGAYMKEELSLSVGELVYGLGERFGPLVKNGQTVDIWQADGGSASEQSYKNIPFYMTNKGYGVFINDPGKVSLEIGSEKTSRVQFSVRGEVLEYFIIYGPRPKAILERYTALTGRPAMPPEWSFGLWLSTSFTTNYDEQTVMSFINGMEERKIPLSVFHFDCFWMKGYNWCDFTWDKEVFPDPKAMLSRIKAKGIKICVWINSYIAQRSPLFDEGKKGGYFIKNEDGSVFQTDQWQPGMAIVDFTNPDARGWYAGYLEKLLDMGVDAFKTDFGERIPVSGVKYFDGGDTERHHNYYTYLYNKTVFELLERKRGKGEACLFARSATSGSQKFPLHWGGDCESTFEAMAETLRGGLSLGLSGFGFWSHDIGGFEGTPNAALFKRWLAFGLFSSHSRLHGSYSYRVPWSVDEESADVCRFFLEQKTRIKPYLLRAAKEAHEKGVPVLRAMFIEFPDDPACLYLDRQYMLGPDLLAAPVFSEDGEVSYYLPEGEWKQLLTGETVKGGSWRTEKHGFLSMPLWIRAGAELTSHA